MRIEAAMRIFLVVTALVLLVGCAQPKDVDLADQPGKLIAASYKLADGLESSLIKPLGKDEPLIIATFVDVNNLEQSSPLGRMMAEQVGSRLAQKGYRVIEVKLRQNNIFVKETKGELLLSRDVREISSQNNAAAVIVGTYATVLDETYVSTRLIRAADSVVLAACDISLSKPSKTRAPY